MRYIIEEVGNGFILSELNEWDIKQNPEVFEVEDDADYQLNQCKAGQKLLYSILEKLDLYGSKHDQYRLRIEISGYDDQDEKEKE